MNIDKTIGYVRDAGCVGLGLTGIGYQIVTGSTNVALLTTCMALLGITGAINVRQLRPGSNGSTTGGRGRSSSRSSSGSRSQQSPPAEEGDEA